MVQQHPVDEEAIPAAILRFVRLLDQFREAGHDVQMIGPNDRLAFEWVEFRGVPCLQVPTPGTGLKALDMLFFSLLLPLAIWKLRRKYRPDVWFVDELFVCFGTLFLRFISKDPIVYDVMGIHYYQVRKNNRDLLRHLLLSNVYGLMEHLTLWSSSVVTTVNDAHRDLLIAWTKRPVRVIRDAVLFEDLRPDEKPALPPKQDGDLWLGFVGKISNRRLDDLFHVLPDLCERLPNLKLLIVGSGPYEERYREWTQKLALGERVHFAGFVPHRQLPSWISFMDITYSDDWSDIGFPMKVFEYMALGAATLVEDTPAVREVMRDGENALLYHGRTGLMEGVLRLGMDRSLRLAIGETAKVEALTLHQWEDRRSAFESIFENLISSEASLEK
jgi:glycosyltransferase involved in cell wall biosynthesis